MSRSVKGRVVGSVAAALFFVAGWTSFVIAIALVGTLLATASLYAGMRFDRRRNEPGDAPDPASRPGAGMP